MRVTGPLRAAMISLIVVALVLPLFYLSIGTASASITIDTGSEATYGQGTYGSSSWSISTTLAASGELVVLTIGLYFIASSTNPGNPYSSITCTVANQGSMVWVGGHSYAISGYYDWVEDTWVYNASSLPAGSYTVDVSSTGNVYQAAVSAGVFALQGAALTGTVGTVGSANGVGNIAFSYSPSSGSGLIIWAVDSATSLTWTSPITGIQSKSGSSYMFQADGPIQSYTSEATNSGHWAATGIEIHAAAIPLAYSIILSNGKTYFSLSFATGAGTNIQAAPGQSSSVAAIEVSITSGTATAITLAINRTLPSAMHIQYSTGSSEPSLGSDYLSTTAVTLYSNVAAPATKDIWLWFIVQNQIVGTNALNETVGILVTVS